MVRPLLPALAVACLLAACTSDDGSPDASGTPSRSPTGSATESARTSPAGGPTGTPTLEVTVVADGLDHPWDVVQAPDGTLLVDERGGGLTAVRPDGGPQEVSADFGDLFATGETGLMGMALDPDFADNRTFYTCQGVQDGGDGGPGIHVISWTVSEDWTRAERDADPLVGDIPVNERSGRHGGCRLEFAPDGALLIGTGDNAVGSNPQDLGSRAGKVLRVDARTGRALPDNPFVDRDGADPTVWTYGHRNVQGLAVRPGTDQVFSVEHGPDRDDEVNLLAAGENQGWDPAGGGGYDESVPMTDPELPDVSAAIWSSGSPTVAPSGATFLDGAAWADYDGLLLMGLLRGQGVLALRIDDDGRLVEQFRVPELDGDHGRIRDVEMGVDGALYVTTDNGGDDDVLLRTTPSSSG